MRQSLASVSFEFRIISCLSKNFVLHTDENRNWIFSFISITMLPLIFIMYMNFRIKSKMQEFCYLYLEKYTQFIFIYHYFCCFICFTFYNLRNTIYSHKSPLEWTTKQQQQQNTWEIWRHFTYDLTLKIHKQTDIFCLHILCCCCFITVVCVCDASWRSWQRDL